MHIFFKRTKPEPNIGWTLDTRVSFSSAPSAAGTGDMCEASGRADDGGEGARRRVADRRQRCRRRHPVVHVPHLGIALMSEQQLEKDIKSYLSFSVAFKLV